MALHPFTHAMQPTCRATHRLKARELEAAARVLQFWWRHRQSYPALGPHHALDHAAGASRPSRCVPAHRRSNADARRRQQAVRRRRGMARGRFDVLCA